MAKNDSPNPPTLPIITNIHIVVRSGAPIKNADIEVVGIGIGLTDELGVSDIKNARPDIKSAVINVSHDKYIRYSQHHSFFGGNESFDIDLVPIAIPIEPVKILGVANKHFTFDSIPGRIQSVTGFTHFEKYVRTGLFDELFIDFMDLIGANTIRDFANWSVTNFSPKLFPDSYDRLKEYITKLAVRGKYLDICATDLQIQFANDEERLSHLKSLASVCSLHTSILFGFVNEPWKNGAPDPKLFLNQIDKSKLLWTTGANTNDQMPFLPHGSYIVCHTERDNEWMRRGAGDTKDLSNEFNKPVYQEEPRRDDKTPKHFLEYYASTSLFGSSCYHSHPGLSSSVPEELDLECAKAAGLGWSLIPIDFMVKGLYTALHLSNDDNCPFSNTSVDVDNGHILRIFTKTLGNKAIGVMIGNKPSFKLKTKSNWNLINIVDDTVCFWERI